MELSKRRIFYFCVLLKLGKMRDVWAVRLRVHDVYNSFSVRMRFKKVMKLRDFFTLVASLFAIAVHLYF